jgi:hypothetical protein
MIYCNNCGNSVASCVQIFVLAGVKHDFESMPPFKGQAKYLQFRAKGKYGLSIRTSSQLL